MPHASPLWTIPFALALAACGDAPLRPSPGGVAARDTLVRSVDLRGRTLVLDGHDGHVEIDTAAGPATLRFVRTARGATRASAEERLEAVAFYEVEADALVQFVWASELEGTGVRATARVPPGADLVVELDRGTIRARGLGPEHARLRADSVVWDGARSPSPLD